MGTSRPYRNKDWLYRKYIVDKLSTNKIAKMCNVYSSMILRWLKKFNIEIRSLSEAWKFRPPRSLETREKMRKAMLGHTHTEETKRKISEVHKGKIISKEQKQKLSLAMKKRNLCGERNPMWGKSRTEEVKDKIREKLKEWNKKNPDIQRGKNNHNWKGGISTLHMMLRRSREYKDWIKSVFKRDRYICVKCGNKGSGNLQAHHIFSWANYPEKRFDLENGLTLCIDCHKAIHEQTVL